MAASPLGTALNFTSTANTINELRLAFENGDVLTLASESAAIVGAYTTGVLVARTLSPVARGGLDRVFQEITGQDVPASASNALYAYITAELILAGIDVVNESGVGADIIEAGVGAAQDLVDFTTGTLDKLVDVLEEGIESVEDLFEIFTEEFDEFLLGDEAFQDNNNNDNDTNNNDDDSFGGFLSDVVDSLGGFNISFGDDDGPRDPFTDPFSDPYDDFDEPPFPDLGPNFCALHSSNCGDDGDSRGGDAGNDLPKPPRASSPRP